MNQLLMIQYQVIRNDTTKQEIKGLEDIYILGNISKEYCLSHNGIRNITIILHFTSRHSFYSVGIKGKTN